MDKTALLSEIRIYTQLRERLIEEFKLDEDDAALIDTLDGETTLTDNLAKLLRASLMDHATAEALKSIMADNAARMKRFEDRAIKLRALVLWAMGEAAIRKLPAPDFTAFVATGRAPLEITDETTIDEWPERFVRVKKEPDKTAIREHLENGDRLDFAIIGNSRPILTVKTR